MKYIDKYCYLCSLKSYIELTMRRQLNSRLASLLAATFLMLVGTGCSNHKDKATFAFANTDTKFFEYGETRRIGIVTSGVARILFTTPEGWSAAEGGSSYFEVTAPDAQDAQAELSGTLSIEAVSAYDELDTLHYSIEVEIKPAIDLSSAGTANSYIVNRPDMRYKFKATVKGNGTESIAPADAALVWKSSTQLIDYVDYFDGYVYFNTISKTENDAARLREGNAVIAVRDAEENILWSWHIWSTDYTPDPDERFMSRNLGAMSESNETDLDKLRSFGLYYQWGRKDPFIYADAYNHTDDHDMYYQSSQYRVVYVTVVETDAETGTAAYAAANPLSFIVGTETDSYDWLQAPDNALWSTTKTVNDPCPAGWRVPSAADFAAMTPTGAAFDYGTMFSTPGSGDQYWAAAGRRSYYNGILTNSTAAAGQTPDCYGLYWTTDAEGADSRAFHFDAAGHDMQAHHRAGGLSVRCVRE